MQVLDGGAGQIILNLDRDLVPESATPEGITREELLGRSYGLTTVRPGLVSTLVTVLPIPTA